MFPCRTNSLPLSRRRWLVRIALSLGATASASAECRARDRADEEASAPESRLVFDAPQVQRWKIGLILNTPVTCRNVFATFPVPQDWPEQTVKLVNQTIDPLVTNWEFRDIAGGARQVALTMDRVPARSTVEMSLEFEVERSRISSVPETDDLLIPNRGNRQLRLYTGNSPYIDASHPRIKKVSRELAAATYDSAWDRVEGIYDYVREHVKYTEGDLKNASDALKDGQGDCEEMTSLFVALCRNARIPARMVWIPDHCYPEFYLEDPAGHGHWFPCQAAGTRQFGVMEEYRPVLQKGDRFKVKEKQSVVRYVSEFFQCDKQGKGNPKPEFIRIPTDI